MRIKTLFGKVTLLLLVIFASALVVFYFIVINSYDAFEKVAAQQLNRNLAKNIVIDKKLGKNFSIEAKTWKKVLHSAMVSNPTIDLYFIDLNGAIRNYALHREEVIKTKVNLKPILQFLKPNSMLPIYGDDPRSLRKKKLFSAAPLITDGRQIGYLYIVLNHGLVKNKLGYAPRSLIVKSFLLTTAIVLMFMLSCALLIFKLVYRRVEKLSDKLLGFKQSQFTQTPQIKAKNRVFPDEVDRLESIFSELAALAVERMKQLDQKDQLRRDLISQICHDIRTPLTSLNGNLETLIDSRKLMDEKQIQQFLDISAEQGRVIVKLVDDLYLLSRLDDVDYKPRIESFCINELIHDTVKKYDIHFRVNNLSMTLMTPNHQVPVNADIGMIQQLFDNLLENAFKFTPCDGEIAIVLKKQGSNLCVFFENSGATLAAYDLNHLFDKFYQVKSKVRGKHTSGASAGSGLGLTVCKRIVESHGGSIVVENRVENGVRFVLNLPICELPARDEKIFLKNKKIPA